MSKRNLFLDRIVYVLMDPRKSGPFRYGRFVFSHEPFYVGKGSPNRCFAHIPEAKTNPKKSPRLNKIRKLLSLGKGPIVRIVRKNLLDFEANELESRLISAIGRHGCGPLVNLTDGGDGASGYTPHVDTVLKRELKKANRSAEDKEKTAELQRAARKIWVANRTKRDKEEALKKFRATLASKSVEEAAITRLRRSESRKLVWAKMSSSKRKAREIRRLATLALRTPEQVQASLDKRSASMKKTLALKRQSSGMYRD